MCQSEENKKRVKGNKEYPIYWPINVVIEEDSSNCKKTASYQSCIRLTRAVHLVSGGVVTTSRDWLSLHHGLVARLLEKRGELVEVELGQCVVALRVGVGDGASSE